MRIDPMYAKAASKGIEVGLVVGLVVAGTYIMDPVPVAMSGAFISANYVKNRIMGRWTVNALKDFYRI